MNVRVKICGITRLEDALTAADAGADALGFIFHPESPRALTPGQAAGIIARLPPFVVPVGVFVNADREELLRVAGISGVRCLQLHGDEPPELAGSLPLPVIKAFRAGGGFDPRSILSYRVSAVLLDGAAAGVYGGTGTRADWKVAAETAQCSRLILAGGLAPENVAGAIAAVRPYGVDVSSGVERSPGIKEPSRIREFIQAVRSAGGGTGPGLQNGQ